MNTKSENIPLAACSFPINLIPNREDFAAAQRALDSGDDGYISGSYFQNYVALIAACTQRGHRSMAEIMAHVAPIVGAENAVHIPWLIQILSGPAYDVHLWDWDGQEPDRYFYGPTLELKPSLASAALPSV